MCTKHRYTLFKSMWNTVRKAGIREDGGIPTEASGHQDLLRVSPSKLVLLFAFWLFFFLSQCLKNSLLISATPWRMSAELQVTFLWSLELCRR